MAGAPFGNQNGLGHGRPPEYDVIKEADELLAWAKKDQAIILLDFVNPKPYTRHKLAEFARQSDYFRRALEKAHELIASRREHFLHSGNFNQVAFNRYQHNYDSWLKQCDRDDKEHEYGLKAKAAKAEIEEVETIRQDVIEKISKKKNIVKE